MGVILLSFFLESIQLEFIHIRMTEILPEYNLPVG